MEPFLGKTILAGQPPPPPKKKKEKGPGAPEEPRHLHPQLRHISFREDDPQQGVVGVEEVKDEEAVEEVLLLGRIISEELVVVGVDHHLATPGVQTGLSIS